METIYYKRTEKKVTEHRLDINPFNCFMKCRGLNNVGYKYVGILPKGNRFVTIHITDQIKGADISFSQSKRHYINKLAFQTFVEENPNFITITKAEFIKALKDRLGWNANGLFELNLED